MSGPQCFNNPPTLSSTTGSGSLQEIAGIKTYVSGSQDSKLAILMISDAFGYEAPKLRKLADKVAGAGFLVVVPDLFYGDPFNHQKYATGVQSWLAAHPPIDSFVKVFPGVKHGWTLRYDDEDEEAIRVAEEAHSDMLNWLTNYIK
nr:endo-1,3;1,4-beta-D-glucanase-like [Ipomoea batatas]